MTLTTESITDSRQLPTRYGAHRAAIVAATTGSLVVVAAISTATSRTTVDQPRGRR